MLMYSLRLFGFHWLNIHFFFFFLFLRRVFLVYVFTSLLFLTASLPDTVYYIDIVLVGYLESDVTNVNKVEYVDKVNTQT